MTGVEKMNQYISDVKSGKILTNYYVKQAIKRYERDIDRSQKNDPEFPYVFDEDKANRFILFSESMKLYKNEMAGKPQIFLPWQAFVFSNIYGWVHKDTGFRRFRRAFIFVSRQNCKSHMCASSLLWDLLQTNGAEGIIAATKKDQAKIAFTVACEMIRQNPALAKRLRVYKSTSRIVNEAKAGYVMAAASGEEKLNGISCSCIIADELAVQRNYDLINVLLSGAGSRPESLCLEITSGSDNLTSPGYQEWIVSKEILNNTREDDTFFCMLYGLDDNDDWKDPKNLIKANPSMNVAVKEDWLIKQMKAAIINPSLEPEFRTKNCNQWINSLSAWIQPRIWEPIERNSLTHKLDTSKPYYAVGAVDLSKRNDLTAFTVCIYQDGYYYLKHCLFFPLESLKEKIQKDNELWSKWLEQDLVTGTPGRVIDYDYVKAAIEEAHSTYNLQAILFDPYNRTKLIDETEALPWIEVNQSMKYLSPFIKSAEEEIFKGKVVDNNPVSKWQFLNAEVYRDPNDNQKIVKPDMKKDSGKRIDAVITSCMAIGYAKQQVEAGEVDLRDDDERLDDLEKMLASLNI